MFFALSVTLLTIFHCSQGFLGPQGRGLSYKYSTETYQTKSDESPDVDRKDLWKSISVTEKQAVELLTVGEDKSVEEAFKLLAKSISMKGKDPFMQLATAYNTALENKDTSECERLLAAMKNAGVPPHIAHLSSRKSQIVPIAVELEDVDPGSTFSDTVTEKIRVKVNSFYDAAKSDPSIGKYMFWYKVGIYNEGSEPVQIVGRMWEIEKCEGEKDVVRGSGIMSTQPIIPPGDVFTYQSVCPLKLFPPAGKRILGSMSGAYTMCKGNMGQHNFSVKVGKFNLILPEPSKFSTSST
eukprot:gene9297-19295_t